MLQFKVFVAAIAIALVVTGNAYSRDDDSVIAGLGLRESAAPARDMKRWRKPTKIVVLIDSAARLDWFREAVAGAGVKLVGAYNPAQFMAAIDGADGVEGICNADIVAADAQLRWIQTQGAGVEACVSIPRVANGEIVLTNMQRVDSANVAEHAFALILALTRRLPAFLSLQKEKRWDARGPWAMADLQGSTMLIVGLGGNGTAIAERARAFGMRVIATRARDAARPDFIEYVGAPSELANLVGRADVIVNAAPLTPQTANLFNAGMFKRMKRNAIFINVGRGKSVVTADLVAALSDGRLAGAGVDVLDPEPLLPDNPLWRTPNVIITPHVADHSPLRMERFWAVMRENLRRYVQGDKLLSVVDPKRGY